MNRDESRHEETPAVVTAADELVLESAEAAEQLRELLRSGRRRIVLDLRQTAYVSGVGLGLVAEAAKQARRGGGDVKVVVRRPQVRHVFEVGDLGALLEFYDDVESACEAFAECIGEVERTLLWRPVRHE
jgi:anti-anti-sigma factor